jgi:malonyl-CoA decarboxylase
LRGISLGNFLIKNVADVLSKEFPAAQGVLHALPIPGFAAGSAARLRGSDTEQSEPLAQSLKAVAAKLGTDVGKIAATRKAAPSASRR